ncbi:sensor histidine kinase [Streptomyces mirabilis]
MRHRRRRRPPQAVLPAGVRGQERSSGGHRARPLPYRSSADTLLKVIDDGPGVPRPFASRLFEPGQRADPGDGHHGAGLGLPLARRLARSAGGEVTYDPEHTPGARLVVSLPAG